MKRALVVLGVLATVVVAAGAWLAISARSVAGALTVAREQLSVAQQAISSQDAGEASHALEIATASVVEASNEVSRPIWSVAAAIPKFGDTAVAVRGVVTALVQALTAVAPAAETLVKLDPVSMLDQGKVDLPALQLATPFLAAAQTGVNKALATLAETPQAASGSMVARSVDAAREELTRQFLKLSRTLSSVSSLAAVGQAMLGADAPQRYFVAILNPNENRGAGGFLGTWAVLRADRGRLMIETVGSNSDLRSFAQLPLDLGPEYENRYGSDPALVGNSNLSPNFSDGARLWLAAYKETTGEQLDGVLSVDVVALGDMLTAAGQTVTLPSGAVLTGAQMTEFALKGVYEKFPRSDQSQARKEYQEVVAREALVELTKAPNPRGMFTSLANSAATRRVMLYSTDSKAQEILAGKIIGGSLAVSAGPSVLFAPINVSGSKLDAWLEQQVTYEVGRCPDTTGMVRSQVHVRLNSNIPKGVSLPEYVIGLAEDSKQGPINRVLAQIHLSMDSVVTSVTIDGLPVGFVPFSEQGRPAVFVDVSLRPRITAEIQVFFLEPMSGRPASLVVQPLATRPETTIIMRPC